MDQLEVPFHQCHISGLCSLLNSVPLDWQFALFSWKECCRKVFSRFCAFCVCQFSVMEPESAFFFNWTGAEVWGRYPDLAPPEKGWKIWKSSFNLANLIQLFKKSFFSPFGIGMAVFKSRPNKIPVLLRRINILKDVQNVSFQLRADSGAYI